MRVLLPLFAAITVLVACSSRDLYRTGQGWQAEQCRRLQDPAERSRCEKSTARRHDDDKAEADKARSAPR